MKREPRGRYEGGDYGQFEEGLTRRSALRRLGGLGGLVLLGSSPWTAAMVARARDGEPDLWYVQLPSGGEWHSFLHGEQPVWVRVALDVTCADTAGCLMETVTELVTEIEVYLLTLDLADFESDVARPTLEEDVVSILAEACPPLDDPGDDDTAGQPPGGDDDSAAGDDDTTGPSEHPDLTLVRLDLQLTEPDEEWDLMGVIGRPSCACRLPSP